MTRQLPRILEGKLAFCAEPTAPCWAIDASGASWSRLPAPSDPSITVTPTAITSCAADGKDCVSIAGTFEEGTQAIASDDRTRVATWAGANVDVYDVKSGKRLSRITGWKSPSYSAKQAQMQQVRFVGPSLAVWESWTPVSSAARLYDPRTGKRIADIGKAGAEIETWAVQVAGDTWAFAGFDPKVYLVNVKTGKLAKTIKLPGGQGGRIVAGKLADGRLAVVSDDTNLVDVSTGKVSPLTPPTCGK